MSQTNCPAIRKWRSNSKLDDPHEEQKRNAWIIKKIHFENQVSYIQIEPTIGFMQTTSPLLATPLTVSFHLNFDSTWKSNVKWNGSYINSDKNEKKINKEIFLKNLLTSFNTNSHSYQLKSNFKLVNAMKRCWMRLWPPNMNIYKYSKEIHRQLQHESVSIFQNPWTIILFNFDFNVKIVLDFI